LVPERKGWRLLRRTLIAVLAIALVYTAVAWLIGMLVQGQLQRDEQRLTASASYLTLQHDNYRRGVFSSTEQLTYGLAPALQPLLTRAGGGSVPATLRVILRHRIAHGPLPRLRGWGLAYVRTDLLMDSTAAAMPAGSQPLLRLQSSLGWLGSLQARITGPVVQQHSGSGQLDWSGLSGTLQAGRGLSRWSLTLSAPGMHAQNGTTRLQLSGLTVHTNLRRVFDTLYIGDTELRLADLRLQSPGSEPFELQGLQVRNNSVLTGQFVQQQGEFSAERLQTAGFNATQVRYQQNAAHLYGPSLAALVRALRAVRQPAGNPAAAQGATLAALRQYGLPLAQHEPVLQIKRAGFVMPQGQLSFSAQLAVPGIAQESARSSQADDEIALLARHLQARAALRVDAALADALLGGSAQQGAYAAQLQQLIQLGYVRREAGAYVCDLVYDRGQLHINGEAFPPQP
jgi:uncharacterized protein YdgA (DUF945 family)